jgi:hypothetical protein
MKTSPLSFAECHELVDYGAEHDWQSMMYVEVCRAQEIQFEMRHIKVLSFCHPAELHRSYSSIWLFSRALASDKTGLYLACLTSQTPLVPPANPANFQPRLFGVFKHMSALIRSLTRPILILGFS